MRPLLIAALALAGLAIGSWQRALVFRYAVAAGEPQRVACPACGCQIISRPAWLPAWSALSVSGRCPGCAAGAGPPRLTIELTSAILLGLLAAQIQPGPLLAAYCLLAVCAVPLAYIDVSVRRLPNALTGPAYAGTLLVLILAAALGGHWPSLARAALGGLALATGYLIIAFISPEAVGGGDRRLSASVGTALAWSGWSTLLAGVFAGFLLAAICGVALLALRRGGLRQHLPFGPFMLAGMFLVILATPAPQAAAVPTAHLSLLRPASAENGRFCSKSPDDLPAFTAEQLVRQ
jgi:leader peptidase (prepilin peptidase)/N-methyltransferase